MGPAVCAAGIRRWEFFIKSSCDNANLFFQTLEAMVVQDITLSSTQNLRDQSLFAVSQPQQRDVWEKDNAKIVGYATDIQGICHTIHRIGNLKQFGYWNLETRTQILIKFKKNVETGEYMSDLGTLSAITPTKQAESRLNETSLLGQESAYLR